MIDISLKLFKHQTQGIKLLSEHDHFGLFWDMGSGKTLTMLIHLSNLCFSGDVHKILWLAPKSALGAVERDLRTMEKNDLVHRSEVLRASLTCMNYEKLSRKDSKWRKLVDTTDWDVIVCDEAHCLCHPTSNRTKYIVGSGKTHGVCERIKYRYAMTGTPVTNSRYEDFWSFMKLMKINEYYSYREFEEMYVNAGYIPGTYIKLVRGYRNIEELLNTVSSYSQSITKDECLDLPEVMPDNVITIPWKGGAKQQYDVALNEDILEATDEVIDNALVRTLRLRQIATGHITDGDKYISLDSYKNEYVLELVENNPHKTVIFYQFKATFDMLAKMFDKHKIPYMYLNGDQSNKNIWIDFQEKNETECRVFLVQYQSGNAGIDLYTASDTIFYEPTNSSTVLNQARSRTHRQGVSRACTFTFLLTEGSIEVDMYNKLRNHEDFNEKLWIELKRKEYMERSTIND